MSRSRIGSTIDRARTANDAATEQLLRQVVGALVPYLQRQVGAIHHREGERSGTTWSTEGWLDDGTYVSLSVAVGADEVVLLLDTAPALKPYVATPLRDKIGLVTTAAVAAFATWWHWPTIKSIVGGLVAGGVAWTTLEIMLNVRKERIAISRRLVDERSWRQLLERSLS
jgi:hypothetical protein